MERQTLPTLLLCNYTQLFLMDKCPVDIDTVELINETIGEVVRGTNPTDFFPSYVCSTLFQMNSRL